MGVTVTSTTFAFLGSCPDSFVVSSPYGLGTRVQADGIVYECISDYDCSGFAFEPGSSSYGDLWREKWTMVGSCDNGTTTPPPTSTPSHQPSLSPSTSTPSSTPTITTPPTETKQPLSTSQTATSVQFSYEEFNSTSQAVNDVYQGPEYVFSSSVTNFKRLPRFGHGNDITSLFSSYQDEQTDYAAGLIALFLFLFIIFLFWSIVILVFKAMGRGNAGFLSGYHFVLPDPIDDNEKKLYKRPRRVRVVFLISTVILMVFTFLLVTYGFKEAKNASIAMGQSFKTTEDIITNAEDISINLEKVGDNSITIRDEAVQKLDNICPADPNIEQTIGLDIMAIAQQAKDDLTMLADFIKDGLEVLNGGLNQARRALASANTFNDTIIQFWDWQMKLLVVSLFILSFFLAVGVLLVMLNINIKVYQKALTYFVMPLFVITIIISCIVCCAILPISASSADACSGGGEILGGPDDTILTMWRNIRGYENSTVSQFVSYYTQRCNPDSYPFGFLSTYLDDLNNAVESTGNAAEVIHDNQALLSERCGREFTSVPKIVDDMDSNLNFLQQQVDASLHLIKCESINELYVNILHDAGCTQSVDAFVWIFASTLVISICGLIMIMLRASYYPVEYLKMSSDDELISIKQESTKSLEDLESTSPVSSNPISQAIPLESIDKNPRATKTLSNIKSVVRFSSRRRVSDASESEIPQESQDWAEC